MPTLAIYLDAPMMSWGASSKFQYRETGAFPTKSALIGLLAAAAGIDKHAPDEAQKLAPLTDLKLTVVKIDKQNIPTSRLTDFHTVGGGYDKKASLREKMSIPKKASGAPFGTVITRRSYLTDAAFIALFEGDSTILTNLKAALLDPVWGVWFGRKTCLPSTPLTPTIGASPQAALDELCEIIPKLKARPLAECEHQREARQEDSNQEGTFYQSDQPTAFGDHQGPVPAPYRARGIIHHRPQ
ncbi:MAG: CRISPR system Cascade subunit CasD [Akkermansiaceae bacterium]|jgi:CRISPR system Cascade subunit CasD